MALELVPVVDVVDSNRQMQTVDAYYVYACMHIRFYCKYTCICYSSSHVHMNIRRCMHCCSRPCAISCRCLVRSRRKNNWSNSSATFINKSPRNTACLLETSRPSPPCRQAGTFVHTVFIHYYKYPHGRVIIHIYAHPYLHLQHACMLIHMCSSAPIASVFLV